MCFYKTTFTKSNYLNKDETANRPLISLVSYRSQIAFIHFKALIMAKKKNGLFVNRFEIATRGSYTNATYVFKQHVDSLFADSTTSPIALNCYNRAKPKYDLYQASHTAHSSQTGTQGGKVQTMKVTLKGMPLHVDDWEAKIKVVYAVDTEEYKILLPKGKAPFNSGSQQKRVDAVETLLTSIGTDASLATVKAIIQTFYDAMLVSFNVKDVSKASTKTDSKAIETARIKMCNVMEGNYGLLIDDNQDEPMLASKYFDEAYMSNTLQVSFDLKVKLLTTKTAIKRTYQKPLTQQFQINNRLNTTLKAFLSVKRNGLVGLVFVTIPPMSIGIYNLVDMGDNATQKFLNIQNMNDLIKADVTIKVL